MLVEQRN